MWSGRGAGAGRETGRETDEVTRNAVHPVSFGRFLRGDGGAGLTKLTEIRVCKAGCQVRADGLPRSCGGAIDGVKERSECDRGDENISGPTLQGERRIIRV